MKTFTLKQLVSEELRQHCAVPENEFWKIVYRRIIEELEKQIQIHFPMTYTHKEWLGRTYKVEFVAMSTDDCRKMHKLVWKIENRELREEIIQLLYK